MPQPSTVPQTPSPARAPTSPQPHVVNAADVPLTAQDIRGIRLLNDDLRRELQDAASRRASVASNLKNADPIARIGFEERLKVLDARIIQIETAISANVAKLNQASPLALSQAQDMAPDPAAVIDRISGDIVPIVAILCVFVFGPFTFALSRFLWKRGSASTVRAPAADQMTMQRLEELQQSVDTIAIEVERISEGQRFVTRVLSEQPALAAGAAEQLRSAKKSAVPTERR